MAKYSNEVIYNVKTTLDASGITKLHSELNKILVQMDEISHEKLISDAAANDAIKTINKVKIALNSAFDTKTGMLNLSKFYGSLGMSMKEVAANLNAIGPAGTRAFNSIYGRVNQLDAGVKNISTSAQKIWNTIGNTARWGAVSMAFQGMVSSVSEAVNYVEKLDDSLIQIRMVSGESAENMREFAKYANQAAASLGSTTVDFTNATKLFIQEGFNLNESKQQAVQATILANVSEQDTATTADQITAYRNAFLKDAAGNALQGQEAIDRMSSSLDKFANIANNTASNVNELMIASQRAASTASAVGADEDTFLASVATIQSVTRESAENIGNGLKSIYTRFADIKMGKDTEDGVSLGQYGQALKSAGVDILDAQGQFKGMTQIFKELQAQWQNLSETQKVAVGEKVAGRFQYNRFAALMNNQEYYDKAYEASIDSDGAMNRMQDIFMESIEAKQNQLADAFEKMFTDIYNSNDFAGLIEDLTNVVNLFNDLSDSVGGTMNIVQMAMPMLMKLFSNSMAGSINNIIANRQIQKDKNVNFEIAQKQAQLQVAGNGLSVSDKNSQQLINNIAGMTQHAKIANQEQIEKVNSAIETNVKLVNEQSIAQEELTKMYVANAAALGMVIDDEIKSEQVIQSLTRLMSSSGEVIEIDNQKLAKMQSMYSSAAQQMSIFEDTLVKIRQSGFKDEKAISSLSEQGRILISTLEKIGQTGDFTSKVFGDTAGMIEVVKKAMSELELGSTNVIEKANLIRQALQKLGENGAYSAEELIRALIRVRNAEDNVALGAEQMGNITKMLSSQERIGSIVNFIGNIGQLTMSLEMLKNVGNIWNNEDATVGEKILSTVTNLGMTIPMLVMAYNGLKDAQIAEVAVSAWVTSGLLSEASAAEIAATGTVSLRIALTELILPITGIIAVIGALTLGFIEFNNQINGSANELKKANELLSKNSDALDKIKSKYDSLKESISKIENSESSLSKLKEGTDEWRKSVSELNSEVMSLIDKYPELSRYIINKNGALSVSKDGINAIEKAQAANVAKASGAQALARNAVGYKEINNQLENFSDKYKTIFGAIQTTENDIKYTKNKINNIDSINSSILNGLENGKIFQQNGQYLDENGKQLYMSVSGEISSKLSPESIEVTNNSIEALNNLKVSVDENTIATNLRNGQIGKGALAGTGYEDSKYASLMSNYIGAQISERASLGKAANEELEGLKYFTGFMGSYDKAISEAYKKYTGTDVLVSHDMFSGNQTISDREGNQIYSGSQDEIWNYLNQLAYLAEGYNGSLQELSANFSKIENSVGKDLFNAFDATKGTFDSEKLKELADENGKIDISRFYNLDKEQLNLLGMESSQQIADAAKQALESGQTQKIDISSAYDFDTDEEVEEYLKNNTNIDSTTLDTATRLRVSDAETENKNRFTAETRLNDAKENVDLMKTTADVDALSKAEKELAEAQKEYDEELKGVSKDQKEYENALKRAAAAEARATKAIEDMNKNFSKNRNILENASKTSIEYAKALNETKEELAGLLDVDAEKLSDGFLQNAHNLDLMQEAAEGSEEAFKELREAATEDIIQNLELRMVDTDGGSITPEDVRSALTGLVDDLNAQNLSVDMEANLNDSEWYNKINAMLESGAITADQLTQVLSAAGYEGELVEVEGHGMVPKTSYKLTVGGTDEKTGFPTSITMEPEISYEPQDVKYMALKGATQKGGISAPSAAANRGGGGKGGGGGGGSKAKTIDTSGEKKAKDIYQEVNETLERTQKTYDNINKVTDRLYGKDKINNIRKSAAAEKEVAKAKLDKLRIQERELDTLLKQNEDINGNKTIHAFLGDDAFNPDGSIKQDYYEAKYDELYNYIKSFEGKDEESNKDAYEDAKQALADFEEARKAYYDALNNRDDMIADLEDSFQTIQDASAEVADALQDMVDDLREIYESSDDIVKTLEKLDNGLGKQIWTTDLSAAQRDAATFFNNQYMTQSGKVMNGVVGQRMEDAAYWGQQMKIFDDYIKPLLENWEKAKATGNAADIDAAMQAYDDAVKRYGYGGYSQSDLHDKSQEAFTNLADAISEAESKIGDLTNAIDDLHGVISDQIDRQLEQFDKITDSLDGTMDMMELLYGNQSYDNQNNVLRQSIDTLSGKVQNIQMSIETETKMLDLIEKTYGKDSEEYQEGIDKINELQGDLRDTVSKIQEDVNKIYENTVNKEVNRYVNGLFGGTYDDNGLLYGDDLEWLSTKWDLMTKNSEQYLDDVERATELQKLQNKYMKAIDGEPSLLNQQKITEQMQEQLKYLREKTNLSKYDVAYAQAQFDILQKTIALQEAQANKSQMKLKRDSQGNYSYVYAANESNVADAQNDLLEAQANAYNLSKEADINTQEGIMDAMSSFRDNLVNVLTNQTLSTETKLERMRYLIDNFKEYVQNLSGDLKDIGENLLTDAQGIADMVAEENSEGLRNILENLGITSDEMLGMIDERFNSFVIDRLDNFTDMEDGLEDLVRAATNAIVEWRKATDKNLGMVGTSYNNYVQDSLNPATEATRELMQTTEAFFDLLNSKIEGTLAASTQLAKYTESLNALREEYTAQIDLLRTKLIEASGGELEMIGDSLGNYEIQKKQKPTSSGGGSGSGGSGGGNSSAADVAYGIHYHGDWQSGAGWKANLINAKGIDFTREVAAHLRNYGYYIPSFDTGGYTGEWGKDGRLALLHQKELILNDKDTENILSAVGMIRDMTYQMKNAAFGTVLDTIAAYKNIGMKDGNNIEQRVQIDATFPNANDANEIRQALLSLADDAYQYSARTY